jgi:citrate synthase
MARWLSREAALKALGVRPQTLYAYVSRGRIAAVDDPGDPRRSLYNADDVASLRNRQRAGRRRDAVAAGAIAWGEPVLDTAISTVAHGRLFYRGHDVVQLAETARFEEVAALLIGCEVAPPASTDGGRGLASAFAFLAGRAATDPPIHGRIGPTLAREASQLVGEIATTLGAAPGGAAHSAFARAWNRPEAADGLRRLLVLLADHELNPSTFATRVTASTGASLAACVLSGLSALSGPLHGTAPLAARRLGDEVMQRGAARVVADRLRDGQAFPGFGHRLYAGIDPRAEAMIASFALPADLADLAARVRGETGLEPNIDFALTAFTVSHHLPPDAATVIFAAARTAGWLAHAIEQVTTGRIIRPRARYVGLPTAS